MGFFFWLAGGAGIFCAIENFTFTNALYYADVVGRHHELTAIRSETHKR